jgi:protein-tyrosine kinase
MSLLERAIRKMSGEGSVSSLNYQNSSRIDEIDTMSTSFKLTNEQLINKKIIHPSFKNNSLVNSFRELRTSVAAKLKRNVVLITSIDSKSGVSYFSRNLAAAIAFDSSKTAILLDCNPKKKSASATFDLLDKNGVCNFITDSSINVEDIIHESGITRFRLVPYGNTEIPVTEAFSHPRFYSLINQLKQKYSDRFVIVDAPPLFTSADARILLDVCDQVILVVPYGKNNKEDIENAARMIGIDKLTGVVFNEFSGG